MATDSVLDVSTADATTTQGPDVVKVVARAWPLLASVLLLMMGSGLQGSLLGVRADLARFNATVTGSVLGLYYLGYVAGSMWVPGLIRSVGHIRVFTALTSIASAAVVVHGVWIFPLPWMLLRFLTGLCVSGLFITTESWINDVATSSTRGSLLAVYNTVVTVGLAGGTLLLNAADAAGFVLFVLGSVLVSLAAVPVALAPNEAPAPQWYEPRSLKDVLRSAPLGVTGAATSGFSVGAAVGFGAVYATRAGFGVSGASQFVVSLLVGAIVGQIPLGRWSDRTDRRYVMGAAGLLILAGSGLGVLATIESSFPVALGAGVLVGAGSFSLYGLSFAHVADYLAPSAITATGARIIMVNGMAAAAGPFLASSAVGAMGPEGLFVLLAVVSFAFAFLVCCRLAVRPAVSEERRAHYTPVATSSTVAVLEDLGSEVSGVDLGELRRRRRLLPTKSVFKRRPPKR